MHLEHLFLLTASLHSQASTHRHSVPDIIDTHRFIHAYDRHASVPPDKSPFTLTSHRHFFAFDILVTFAFSHLFGFRSRPFGDQSFLPLLYQYPSYALRSCPSRSSFAPFGHLIFSSSISSSLAVRIDCSLHCVAVIGSALLLVCARKAIRASAFLLLASRLTVWNHDLGHVEVMVQYSVVCRITSFAKELWREM